MAIVNRRDTLFTDEYLSEEDRWVDRATRQMPDPQSRSEILQNEYIRLLCWHDYLRQMGYDRHPAVVAEYERTLQQERETIVRVRMTDAPTYEPDSAEIRQYYEDNKEHYGLAPGALNYSWNVIRNKLVDERKNAFERRWLETAATRHGVVRHEDRLAQLPLLVHESPADSARP